MNLKKLLFILITLFYIFAINVYCEEKCYKFELITFSAGNQSSFDACEAAKGMALAEIGRFVNYTKYHINEEINKGVLTKSKIKLENYGKIISVKYKAPECNNDLKIGECCYNQIEKYAYTKGIIYYKKINNNFVFLDRCENTISSDLTVIEKKFLNKPQKNKQSLCDALIVKVDNPNFEPAPNNEINSENGTKLFSGDMVNPDILTKKIPYGFMTDLNDAKMLLKSWGASNPIIIKANKVKDRTKVIISNSDYIKVYSCLEKNNFLKKGNVIFLLKK